jgi:hypothetical protein
MYQTPAIAYDDQVLGRAFLSQHRDNNDYFLGIIDRWRPVPEALGWSWFDDNWGWRTIWDGWHLLTEDCKTLHYYFVVADDENKNTCALYYDGVEVDSRTGTGTKSDTYSLALKDPGFYQVQYRVYRSSANRLVSGSFLCAAPWTSYTADTTSYSAGSVSDGSTIAATDFNKLRTNGLHFYGTTPRNMPFIERKLAHTASATTTQLWQGRIVHYGAWLNYKFWMKTEGTDQSDNRILVYYDENLILTVYSSDFVDEVAEGRVSISGYSGTIYLRVVLKRDDDTTGATARVCYLYTVPATPLNVYPIPEYTVGQDVYGDTSGQTTAVKRLFLQQAQIAAYLQRQDFAVRKPEYYVLGRDWHYDYFFIRQHDLLYYKGEGIRLVYGSRNISLPDALDTYEIYDLNTVTGLHLGSAYTLEGLLEYAMEVPA